MRVVAADSTKVQVDDAPLSQVRVSLLPSSVRLSCFFTLFFLVFVPCAATAAGGQLPPRSDALSPPLPRPSPSFAPPPLLSTPLFAQAAKDRVKAVGITHLTPVQERTLRAAVVDGRDVLVQAPTGSGKTLAYLLPIAHALARNDAAGAAGVAHAPGSPSAIVFLPTRELAAQVFAHATTHVTAAGFPAVLCVGGASDLPQIAAIRAGGRVIVGTPGRIKELVDRGMIKTDAVIIQVLDEADRLLDGGFEQDVEAVMRPPGGQCQTLCLSATMPAQLARFLQRRLPPDHVEVSLHGRGGSNVGGTVEHLSLSCHHNDVVATILSAVDAYAHGGDVAGAGEETKNLGHENGKNGVTGQAIVFVETKAYAEQLSGTLIIAYEVRPMPLLTDPLVTFPLVLSPKNLEEGGGI